MDSKAAHLDLASRLRAVWALSIYNDIDKVIDYKFKNPFAFPLLDL